MSPVSQLSGKLKFYTLVLLFTSPLNHFKREITQPSTKLSIEELLTMAKTKQNNRTKNLSLGTTYNSKRGVGEETTV